MKKLALLMFTILILGCENQNPVSEPNEEITEIQAAVAEIQTVSNQFSKLAASLDMEAPTIADASVTHGDVEVDPDPLNRDGIRIIFSERISLSHFNLRTSRGGTLGWETEWNADGQTVTLTPPHLCSVLRHSTTYTIDFVVQDFGSWQTEGFITFSTKSRSVKAAPAIDIEPPTIAYSSMRDNAKDVDPEPLNRDGIWYTFSERNIPRFHFDLRLEDGPTLGWIVQWSADGFTVTLTPPNQCSVLRPGTTYVVDIFVQDNSCLTTEVSIKFTTKADPN